ncbi:pre-60S ribosomal particles component [Nowakowskiella sp. JEL0407]|nr:pre-60S ribosomal particles component [Nowakowskiella sp. JEL0407]
MGKEQRPKRNVKRKLSSSKVKKIVDEWSDDEDSTPVVNPHKETYAKRIQVQKSTPTTPKNPEPKLSTTTTTTPTNTKPNPKKRVTISTPVPDKDNAEQSDEDSEEENNESASNSDSEEDIEELNVEFSDDDNEDPSNSKLDDETKQERMSNAINKLLSQELALSESTRPILANKKSIEQKIDSQKLDEKAKKLISSQKKKRHADGKVLPDITRMDYEKKLRKVATRGVVQLFNAIRIAQKVTAPTEEKIMAPTAVAEKDRLTKNVFLKVLKGSDEKKEDKNEQKKKTEKAKEGGGGDGETVSWLKQDYMTKPATSHWDEGDDDL